MKKFFWKIKLLFKTILLLKNWYEFVSIYFGLANQPYLILNVRDGYKIKIRTKSTDIHVFTEIWLDNIYLKKFNLNSSSTIIDIGAHIGLFSIFASRKFKNSKIYSVEPNSENFDLFKENIRMNKIQNIKPFNFAVSSKNGSISFYINEKDSASHSIFKNKGKLVNVKSCTLEKIIIDNKISTCDLLKMDCEGAEYDILLNTPNEILSRVNKIALEYEKIENVNYSEEDIITKLKKCGFQIIKFEPRNDYGYIFAEKV